MMELEILSKETIKPISSTPPELKNLPLSIFDQQVPNLYLQLLFFYHNLNISSGCSQQLLKDSLSKTLTFYYPFAGRLRADGNSIDCNDMGATISVAKLRCPMSEYMNNFNSKCEEILKLTFLDEINEKDQRLKPLLCVQLTQFQCGGEVIYVLCSHKVADFLSFVNFMYDWASIARSSGHGDPPMLSRPPQFNGASFFPPKLDGSSGGHFRTRRHNDQVVVSSKRFVFEGSKIAALKGMVCEKVKNPTRVQLLTALIYKAALSAKKSVTGNTTTTTLLQHINLRNRVNPPFPATLSGNIISFFIALSTKKTEQREMELWKLVSEMKRNFKEYCKMFPTNYRAEEWKLLYKLHAKELMERILDCTLYTFTSGCKYPIYDVDFGWGKPAWVTVHAFPWMNTTILMDAKDGEGIEAMVCLEKKEMELFEQNQELLSFCELKIPAQMFR